MKVMALFLGIAAVLSTLLGGTLALKLRDKLHLILGFSAGAVIAVAFFDLMPESLELARDHEPATVIGFVALGFLLYLLLDRLLVLGHSDSEDSHAAEHSHTRGHIRAGSLSLHSF